MSNSFNRESRELCKLCAISTIIVPPYKYRLASDDIHPLLFVYVTIPIPVTFDVVFFAHAKTPGMCPTSADNTSGVGVRKSRLHANRACRMQLEHDSCVFVVVFV